MKIKIKGDKQTIKQMPVNQQLLSKRKRERKAPDIRRHRPANSTKYHKVSLSNTQKILSPTANKQISIGRCRPIRGQKY